MSWKVEQGDCLDFCRAQPDNAFALTFGSPPYEAARTYGIDFKLRGQDWVDWMVERIVEFVRVTSGLVAMVVEGQTRQYRWSATPALLMADLHRRGIHLRKPPIFKRVGIPGSGGPDWLRNDYEFIVCCTKGAKLPWSNNVAIGHPPKWGPGGEMAHRLSDGTRVNQWGPVGGPNGGGKRFASKASRPSHVNTKKKTLREGVEPKVAAARANGLPPGAKLHTKHNGTEMRVQCYTPPVLANPGNVIDVIVGGGTMGDELCHENEAPFPEKLAEFFIRSFAPPDGIVYDPFSGSGTTGKVATATGRQFVGTDIRQSQVELTKRRLASVQRELIA